MFFKLHSTKKKLPQQLPYFLPFLSYCWTSSGACDLFYEKGWLPFNSPQTHQDISGVRVGIQVHFSRRVTDYWSQAPLCVRAIRLNRDRRLSASVLPHFTKSALMAPRSLVLPTLQSMFCSTLKANKGSKSRHESGWLASRSCNVTIIRPIRYQEAAVDGNVSMCTRRRLPGPISHTCTAHAGAPLSQ